MIRKVTKWGNSLAVRTPKAFTANTRLKNKTLVETDIAKSKIITAPFTEPNWTLDELLANITADNLHSEVDTGPAVGNEIW